MLWVAIGFGVHVKDQGDFITPTPYCEFPELNIETRVAFVFDMYLRVDES